MTKRILAVITAAALGLCMLTACGKKDNTQTQHTATQSESDTTQQKDDATQTESNIKSGATDNNETAPIEMTAEELENLINTFNNPKSEAEKEEARLRLEAVLKQMEQQQP